MLSIVKWFSILSVAILSKAENVQHNTRQLDPISGGDVLRREIDDDVDFRGSDVMRALLIGRALDNMQPAYVLKSLNSLSEGKIYRTLGRLGGPALTDLLAEHNAGDALERLNSLTGGDLFRGLNNVEGTEVLLAMDQARRNAYRPHQKRTLDTLSGMAFGESKRMDSLSGATLGMSKRNFDEIDNVGFNGWAKRAHDMEMDQELKMKKNGRHRMLALARRSPYSRNPFRLNYSSLAKKNFDEIDRTGFEGFTKREAKATP